MKPRSWHLREKISKYSWTRLILRPSPSTFRFEYEGSTGVLHHWSIQTERVCSYSWTVPIEFTFIRLVQSEPRSCLAFDWPMYHRFADVRICYLPSTRPCFSLLLRRDYPLTSASRKASGTNSFFQSYTEELWQSVSWSLMRKQLFSKL